MKLSIVVAASDNDVIGVGNQLPWRLPDDLKRFKALTMGKPMLMGRKTFESIGRPLPGRTSIVITRQSALAVPGVIVASSIDQALAAAEPAAESMLVGGADIYRQMLSRTHTIHLTRVHATFTGDAYFPRLAADEWCEVDRQPHPADDRHAYAFTFVTLVRRASV
jgi:dihydrofolate reductase